MQLSPACRHGTRCHARPFLLSVIAASTALAATVASAANPLLAEPPKARVDLVTSATTVTGTAIYVGVRFRMQPTWHVYWLNPGDAGTAPQFTWTTPDGWDAKTPQFPTPVSFSGGGLMAYGYKDEIVFPALLLVPDDAEIGSDVTLTMDVDYLVCDPNVCIPEQAEASLTLKVALDAVVDEAGDTATQAALRRVPTQATLLDAETGFSCGGAYTFALPEGATDVELFLNPPADVEATALPVESGDNTYAFTVESRKFGGGDVPTFPAVLGFTTPQGERRGIHVEIPPVAAAAL